METIDLGLVEAFTAVARSASYSAAARTLGVPKSSVSRAIARLEEQLGVVLLHRTTRRVALSTAGAALFERVVPNLTALREALGDLPEQEQEPSGELRITASVDFGVAALADLAAAFTLRYPAIKLDVRLTNRMVDVVAEGFDVALRIAERMADSSLSARKAMPLAGHLFAAP
jgi:DNA-binding transcriptional LysR family regulator